MRLSRTMSILGFAVCFGAAQAMQVSPRGKAAGELVLRGDEHGLYFEDNNGFLVEYNVSAGQPLYTLPGENEYCYSLPCPLDLFNLLPASLKGPLLAIYNELDRVFEILGLRLDQFVEDLVDEAYEIWADAVSKNTDDANGMPTIGEVIQLIVNESFGDQFGIRGVGMNNEWIIGDSHVCSGSSDDRRYSSNPRCSGALAVRFGPCIPRKFSTTNGIQDRKLNFTVSDDDDELFNTTEPNSTEPFRRSRRQDEALEDTRYCLKQEQERVKQFHIDSFTVIKDNINVGDIKGPGTNNQADYRIRTNLIVLFRFKDHANRVLPSREYYDELFNKRSRRDSAESASIRDYFHEASYMKSESISIILDWVDIDMTEAETAANIAGLDGPASQGPTRVCSAITQALSKALLKYDDLDYRQFVMDSHLDIVAPNQIYNIFFITSGFGGENQYSTIAAMESMNRVFSHNTNYKQSKCRTKADNPNEPFFSRSDNHYRFGSKSGEFQVDEYTITGGCHEVEGNICIPARPGIIIHELLHSPVYGQALGDYYEVNVNERTQLASHCANSLGRGVGIGSWGIMGNAWGPCDDQINFPMMTAWSKLQLGWMDPFVVDTNRPNVSYELCNSNMCPDVLIVRTGYDQNEFLVVDAREQVSYDSVMPSNGVYVSHLDLKATATLPQQNTAPDWTIPHAHYYYRVEQREFVNEFECGGENMNEDDLLKPGQSLRNRDRPGQSTRGYFDNSLAFETANITVVSKKMLGQGTLTNIRIENPPTETPPCQLPDFIGYNSDCEAGEFGQRDGTCMQCPVGKYSEQGGISRFACQICPDGYYSNNVGANISDCVRCPFGTYDDISFYPSNGSSCKKCPSDLLFTGTMIPLREWVIKVCSNSAEAAAYSGGQYINLQKNVVPDCHYDDNDNSEANLGFVVAILIALICVALVYFALHLYHCLKQKTYTLDDDKPPNPKPYTSPNNGWRDDGDEEYENNSGNHPQDQPYQDQLYHMESF